MGFPGNQPFLRLMLSLSTVVQRPVRLEPSASPVGLVRSIRWLVDCTIVHRSFIRKIHVFDAIIVFVLTGDRPIVEGVTKMLGSEADAKRLGPDTAARDVKSISICGRALLECEVYSLRACVGDVGI